MFADDPNEIVVIADRMERCARKAAGLIDALLAFARASVPGRGDELGGIRPVLADVVEEMGPLLGRLEAALEVEEVPDVHVRCEEALLHVVVANVVGNAVKYLEGQERRRVRISVHPGPDVCRVDVEDTGPGIPEAIRERIFEPFFRSEGARAAGFGIGLATVHRIVHSRGGRIAVEPVQEGGSRFQIWLPLATAPRADAAVESQARTEPA